MKHGVVLVALVCCFNGASLNAHTPTIDGLDADWCFGALSNTFAGGGRVEDSSSTLTCGECSVSSSYACVLDSDCPTAGETCINPGSRSELVWWDSFLDSAVNDLATVSTTHDDSNLYFHLTFWTDPDPVSLPFVEIGLDVTPGGIPTWHDPQGMLTNSGRCSVSTDRACTSDADCHFCAVSTELPPLNRPRSCGSGCNPDIPADVCDTSQICIGAGSLGPQPFVGLNAEPMRLPDYLLVLDFSRWLIGFGESIQLMKAVGGAWAPVAEYQPGMPVFVNGGPGGAEFAVPWSDFGCTGCPAACSCPDLGPGQEFRFSAMVARGTLTLDYTPDGPIEDVQSEAVAGTTTTTPDDCPGTGALTTDCEVADSSQDAFVPAADPAAAGGRIDNLLLAKAGPPAITLSWNPSCSAADNDYEIYEGTIGSFYDHTSLPGLCTTAGAATATIAPGPGNRYYLVVPTDGTTEGSYGGDSAGLERPGGTAACAAQSLGDCPEPLGPIYAVSQLGQISVRLDGPTLFSSDWASADLTFIGSPDIQYFNLVVNGDWRVRDVPILSTDGPGKPQTQTVNFRILPEAVQPPWSVGNFIDHTASLTTEPLGAAPSGPAVQTFNISRFVDIQSGEQGETLAVTKARTVSGALALQSAFNSNVPNQEAGVNECVPVAISNSLMFLNEEHGLNIPADKITIDAMKTATGWTPGGAPVGPTAWWDLKKAALDADPAIPVTTTTTQSFDDAMTALNDDCDVELRAPGHVAVVRGIVKLSGGDRAIVIQHDTDQGTDGGTKREIVIFDADDGTLWDGWGFDGKVFDRFVIECPE